MDLTKQEILEKLNTKNWMSIKVYMGRAEFSHIEIQRPKKRTENYKFLNITEKDLKRIYDLMHRKRTINY